MESEPDGQIDPISPNTETFFRYEDQQGDFSETFAFTDRNGGGANVLATDHPSLSHNVMMPHSIRGKVDVDNEGPRYCNACHLTENALTNWGPQYSTFRIAMAADNFGALDYNLLKQHLGENPNNDLDSPFFVHMAAGLGTGLFLFDEDGCPTNPIDTNPDRAGCEGIAPAGVFDPTKALYNTDRLVDELGVSTGSNNHPLLDPAGSTLRDGAADPALAGPMGATLLEMLADPVTGVVLDAWLDADGASKGGAAGFVGGP